MQNIVQTLKEKADCNTEMCWLKYLPRNKRVTVRNQVFAPSKPKEWEKKPKEWLSNYDIANVMKQYEESHKNFRFIGPTTIDFDAKPYSNPNTCVENKLCTFSLKKYVEEGVDYIGIVLNLDKHDESGSHWVAIFICIPETFVFYFDSACNPTPKEVRVFAKRVCAQWKELYIKMKGEHRFAAARKSKFKYIQSCPKQHQYENTECGMYSMYFIITMLDKKLSWKEKIRRFRKKRIPDSQMFELRDLYFAKNDYSTRED
jgi:hypothetical protein